MRAGGGEVWLTYEVITEYVNSEHGFMKQQKLQVQVNNAIARSPPTAKVMDAFFECQGVTNLLPWARCIIHALGRKAGSSSAALSSP